jgi:CubicO group peptidase (beta-lactamase class C family)
MRAPNAGSLRLVVKDLLSNLPAVQATLDTLAARHRVPGAMLSIYDGNRTVDLVTGVANYETGVEVTPDTLFQIGSITKVYTATLMMRLVDQGKIDLDAPIRRYLPSFQLSNAQAAETITCRHLVNHSSGIVGDYHADFGEGDDCLERFVDSLKDQEHVYEPGLMFSYSNAAFELAGRVIEAVCGKPYDEVLSEELLEPLGLRSTTVDPREMLRYRYAVGHSAATSPPTLPPEVLMYRSTTPAGGRTSATAADVLRFARLHIDKGRAPNGSIVVSEESIKAMRTPTLPLHGYHGCSVGLGWLVWDWGGEQCVFHTGGTINQLSWVCVLPDRPFAVCLLTNSDTGGLLWLELGRWIFETFADIEIPRVPKPPAVPPSIDLERYAGSYERLTQRLEIEARDDHLHAAIATTSPLRGDSTQEIDLWPVDEQRFYVNLGGGVEMTMTFLEPDGDGRPRYLHFGSRAAVRTDSR